MANTTIALKNSPTPSAVPSNLANGEIAINYADGKIFYKNVTGSIVSISGSATNAFGTVNANNTLVVADAPGDILTLLAGSNITLVADAVNDTITINASAGSDPAAVPAFQQANTARDAANTVGGYANSAFAAANAAYDKANSANVLAFNALPNTTATFSGDLTIAGTLNTKGNVTIGTASGGNRRIRLESNTTKTTLIDTTGNGLRIDGGVGNQTLDLGNNSGSVFNTIRFTNNGLSGGFFGWYMGTTLKMTMDNVGNVGIAITNPTSTLHVNGTANIVSTLLLGAINVSPTLVEAAGRANTGTATANAAFDQANTARTHANSAFGNANAAFDQANTARSGANTVGGYANSAFDKANTVYSLSFILMGG